jgi:uroporphyrin-III C-methyltransferase
LSAADNQMTNKAGTEALAGKVYLVGAGPGDPELLTLRAHRLLQQANIILHDDLVPEPILSLARTGTQVVSVGKRCGAKGVTQAEINERMIASARRGLVVVRLKSGDPAIFGRLAEEIDALESARVPFEVVPGVTAGIAAAASLGVSLTDRRTASRVIVLSNHHAHSEGSARTDWRGLAREDVTLVIYMPGHEFGTLREELLDAGLGRETPAVIVSRAKLQSERQVFTKLNDLDRLPGVASPSVLLIGRALEQAWQRAASGGAALALEQADLILSTL